MRLDGQCGLQAGQLNVNIEINLHADDAAGQVQRNQVAALFDILNGGNAGDGQDTCLFGGILYQHPYRLLAHVDGADGDGGVLLRKIGLVGKFDHGFLASVLMGNILRHFTDTGHAADTDGCFPV